MGPGPHRSHHWGRGPIDPVTAARIEPRPGGTRALSAGGLECWTHGGAPCTVAVRRRGGAPSGRGALRVARYPEPHADASERAAALVLLHGRQADLERAREDPGHEAARERRVPHGAGDRPQRETVAALRA